MRKTYFSKKKNCVSLIYHRAKTRQKRGGGENMCGSNTFPSHRAGCDQRDKKYVLDPEYI